MEVSLALRPLYLRYPLDRYATDAALDVVAKRQIPALVRNRTPTPPFIQPVARIILLTELSRLIPLP
jgi:hypothetical protein